MKNKQTNGPLNSRHYIIISIVATTLTAAILFVGGYLHSYYGLKPNIFANVLIVDAIIASLSGATVLLGLSKVKNSRQKLLLLVLLLGCVLIAVYGLFGAAFIGSAE